MTKLPFLFLFFVLAFSDASSVSNKPENDVISAANPNSIIIDPSNREPIPPKSGYDEPIPPKSGSPASDEVNAPVTFSDASSVSNRPENDVIAAANPDSTIIDPSNREPIPPKSEYDEPIPPKSESPASDEVNVPVTFVKLHPINRRFPRRPLSFHHRPCHHRNDMWASRVEIPYGRDMMLFHGGEDKTGPDLWPIGVVRYFPESYRQFDDDDITDEDDVVPNEDLNDEQEIGFRPIFPGGKIPRSRRSWVYPEEKIRVKKIKIIKQNYDGKEDNDKGKEKENKGFLRNKIRKFLTDFV